MICPYPAILTFFVCWNCKGIIPEIKAIYIFIIHPQTGMMGMVSWFARLGGNWKTACYDLPVRGINWKKNWFLQGVWIKEFCEKLIICFYNHFVLSGY